MNIKTTSLVPGMPAPIANASIPLDVKLRDQQKAQVASAVHSVTHHCYRTAATDTALLNAARKADVLRDHFAALFWTVIAPVNNMAIMEIQEAYHMLSKSSFFRFAVKKSAKQAVLRIDQYDKAVLRVMAHNLNGDRQQYWLDFSDEHYERLRPYIKNLQQAVLQVYALHNITQAKLKCLLSVSMYLLNYSIEIFDKYFEKVKQFFSVDIQDAYRDARLSYVQDPWFQVINTICHDIDIDYDEKVESAFKDIERNVINQKLIGEVGEKAISFNPDIEKEMEEVQANPYSDNAVGELSKIFR